MKYVILILTLAFALGFYTSDAEAQISKKRPVKKSVRGKAVKKRVSVQQNQNSLRDRVKSVKKMMSGEGRGLASVKKPLEVRGQSRQLSMMLVLKNSKDKIQFVKVRENFEREIMNTSY